VSRITALLVGQTAFPFHDLDEMAPAIEAALGDGVALEWTTETDALADLDGYDLVVDYLTDSHLDPGPLDGLCSFVADGGGYLGVHCAADLTSAADGEGGVDPGDEPVPALRDLLGGHFLDHPDRSTFGAVVVDRDHPVTDGVDDFAVYDEPYRVDCDEDRVRVLARMDHPDLAEYPVAWVRRYGDGRVCYSSLGHTVESFENESHRRLLRNAVAWLT
jgi:hypothetical protein